MLCSRGWQGEAGGAEAAAAPDQRGLWATRASFVAWMERSALPPSKASYQI